MAGSPQFKLYKGKEYLASFKHPSDAAILLAAWGEGQIRHSHSMVLYTEGVDGKASENYDAVAQICNQKLLAANRAWWEKYHPGQPYPK